ncbi:APC family permease [Mycoplasma sp. E35C]|uniref:APC family permease n=1 Tax=Mycoplasma sp. E35C TaxID=2801918 RepID=UPI001CA40743|nr:APC family permease [Mycoplasma sp. E35C]QZX48986.1 APC family permease [Mycoplasma sp. E35C]
MSNSISNQQNNSLANATKSKKISFFSGVTIAIGSSIGAGIFFRAQSVLENSQNSMIFAIFCWIFAAFSVIAMALALIEISSGRNDNLSIIGWCQTFNGRYVYKSCKNFMAYIYVPLTYFFMPLYSILSIQDGVSSFYEGYNGLGTQVDWMIMMVLSLVISVYFIVIAGVSVRIGNIQNLIISFVKFIPLVFAIIIGFVVFYNNGSKPTNPNINNFEFKLPEDIDIAKKFSFTNLSPGFGMFISIGAIYFAYDGFYYAAGIQSEMKQPKKTPLAILVGLSFVTVVYLIMAVAMSLGSTDGSPSGLEKFLKDHNLIPVYAAFQIAIGIGVLGIVNGLSLWANRFMEDLVKLNELPFSMKFINQIREDKAIVGLKYNLVIAIPVIIIASLIGGLGYIDSNYLDSKYGTGVGKIYSFSDLMGNWTSVIAFSYIVIAIIGGLINRKKNTVKVDKFKYFIPSAICAVVVMIVAVALTFLQPIGDLILLYKIPYSKETEKVYISRIMLVIVLVLYLLIMFLPIVIEDKKMIKKYGSIEKSEIAKLRIKAEVKKTSFKSELLAYVEMLKRNKLSKEFELALQEVQEANQTVSS